MIALQMSVFRKIPGLHCFLTCTQMSSWLCQNAAREHTKGCWCWSLGPSPVSLASTEVTIQTGKHGFYHMLGDNIFCTGFTSFYLQKTYQGNKTCQIGNNYCLCCNKAQVIALVTKRTVCHTCLSYCCSGTAQLCA